MKYHVTIRGRGWNLQDRLRAETADDALTRVCEKWNISRAELIRIHVQEDNGDVEGADRST